MNTLTAATIFRELAKKRKKSFPWKGTQYMSYHVVGSQRVNLNKLQIEPE